MAYTITDPEAGYQPIGVKDTVQNHPLGSRVMATDPTYGGGTFIYLKGASNTVVGSLVTYDQVNGTTALSPNTANITNPMAVAMTANTSSYYGWYQVVGAAVIKKTAIKISPASRVWQSGTTGRVFATATTGKQIQNAITINTATVASATSTVTVQIAYPSGQGQII